MALPAFFQKIKGTFENFFAFGGAQGPKIGKVDAGRLTVTEDDETTLAKMRGADPLAAQDFLTKAYFEANNASANGVTTARFPIGTGATQTSVNAAIPNNAKIHECQLNLTTPYDNAATIKVERAGDATVELMGVADNDPSLVGLYSVPQYLDYGVTGSGQVKVTIANAPTVGAGEVVIKFSVPTNIT